MNGSARQDKGRYFRIELSYLFLYVPRVEIKCVCNKEAISKVYGDRSCVLKIKKRILYLTINQCLLFSNQNTMNRNKFLSLLGMPFLALLLFSSKNKQKQGLLTDCNDPITPPIPEGPFYKDEKLNRVDIRESKKGRQIEYVFMVEDKNCKPIEGAIVDIWQCDADGHYSDFDREKTLGQTWLRGYQKTDHTGTCRFRSIFPGWYTNRVTHLHAKVHINGNTLLTTNLFFKKEIQDKIYQKPLYTKGPNPIAIPDDFELKKIENNNQRYDTLLMDVIINDKEGLTGHYKFAIV